MKSRSGPHAGTCEARESSMRVGILGSGLMGAKLGTLFARAGHEVYSATRAASKSSGSSPGTPRVKRGPTHRKRLCRKRTRCCSPRTGRESRTC
jgi:Rossmann-like domain